MGEGVEGGEQRRRGVNGGEEGKRGKYRKGGRRRARVEEREGEHDKWGERI